MSLLLPVLILTATVISILTGYADASGPGPRAGTPNSSDSIRVHCTVFHDLDADGTRQPDEPGLAGIRITNGLDILSTGRTGELELAVDRTIYRFVTMTIPAGKWATTDWFHWVPVGTVGPDSAVFGLKDYAPTAQDPLRWVHLADTQVYDWSYRLDEDLQALAEMPEVPAFIIDAGDIVHVAADTSQWEIHRQLIADSQIPFLHVPGNHDLLPDGDHPLAMYERYLGPPYYSFEAGSWHFSIYCSEQIDDDVPRQHDWLVNDVAQASPGSHLVLIQHFMIRDTSLPRVNGWAGLGIEAVFSGHWHSLNLSSTSAGITEYNMSRARGGPLDRTPRVLGIVTSTAAGDISYDLRRASLDHHAVLAHPRGGQVVQGGELQVIAQALDTSQSVSWLNVTIRGPGGSSPPTPLLPAGVSVWQALVDISTLPPGAYSVKVNGAFQDGWAVGLQDSFILSDAALPATMLGRSWPMFRREPGGTSFTRDALRPPLNLIWTYQVDGMVALSSPVVAGEMVYFGYRPETRPENAGIVACNALTGEPLWSTHIRGGIALAPAVTGNVVIATALCDSVYGLDAMTGQILWSVATPGTRFDTTAPICDGPHAWVSGEPHTYCVDWTTGQLIWSSDYLGNSWFPYVYSAPALGPDFVYYGLFGLYPDFGFNDGGFAIVDRNDGSLYLPYDNGAYRSPICTGDTLFVVGAADLQNQMLTARDLTGAIHWTAPVNLRYGTGSPALGHGVLVVAGARGAIEAFQASDGTHLWTHEVGPALYHFLGTMDGCATYATPAIADSVVYVGSLDGNLYALDLLTGTLWDSWHFGAPVASSAAISGNMLFVGAGDGHLYALAGNGDDTPVAVRPRVDGEGDDARDGAGTRFSFAPPWPNPGSDDCRLAWSQSKPALVELKIFDLRGRLVRTLLQQEMPAGQHHVRWDCRDQTGRAVAAGNYFAHLKAGSFQRTGRMLIVR